MKTKYRKMLLVLLPVIACILVFQAASAVAVNVFWGGETIGSEEGKGETEMGKNIPEKREPLVSYIKNEIQRIKTENGGGISNDQLTQLFMACDAEGYVHLTKEGAPYITSKDGGTIQTAELAPEYESRVTKEAFDRMIELAETYVAHAADMKYGNFYTPFNDTTTNQIDCSSFVQLILYGIPYETSRFAAADDKNTPRYDLGISLPDNPYDDDFGPYRYLANELGHYAFDHDFAFYPNADCTNIQPGDILFFSTNKNNEGYFMDITHVAICVERQEDDIVYVVHGNNNDVANYYKIRLFSPQTIYGSNNAYQDSLVLVARYPVKAED